MTRKTPLVLVYEYFTGGGYTGHIHFDSLDGCLIEGQAMLESILFDFTAWGRVDLVTLRDSRLPPLPSTISPKKVEMLPVSPESFPNSFPISFQNHRRILSDLASDCKAALIIAPETDGILADLSEVVSKSGTSLLGSYPQAVSAVSDKWHCYQILAKAGLSIPETHVVNLVRNEHEIAYPFSPSPFMERGLGGEVYGQVISDRFLKEWDLNNMPINSGSAGVSPASSKSKWKNHFVFNAKQDRIDPKNRVDSTMNYPFIIKPISGTDCQGAALIENKSDLAFYCEKVHRLKGRYRSDGISHIIGKNPHSMRSSPSHLMQTYIEGTPVSVSLLVRNKQSIVLSLNAQFIDRDGIHLSYRGGQVPYDHPNEGDAVALAQHAVSQIAGLNGYVGVDLVIDMKGKPWFMEINPRLTTSYVGLCKASPMNLAKAIWENTMENRFPTSVPINEKITFSVMDR